MSNKEIWKGNEAMSESAIRAGCRFFAGYPITPQTTITEYLSWRLDEVDGTFIQAESELSAINMVVGGTIAGSRSMTATSGPGLSLMTETLSVMAGGRIPAVIVDVQRGGAGTGNLQGAQSDYNMVTKSLGHGGLKGLVYGPSTVQELCDIMYESFELAEKYRVPVIILSDASLGQMMEAVELKEFQELPADMYERDYVLGGEQTRKKVVFDTPIVGPYKTLAENIEDAYKKYYEVYQSWDDNEVRAEEYMMEDAEYVIAAWGIAARIAKSAIRKMRQAGIKVGMIRPISLVPFPNKVFAALDKDKIKGVLTVEMSIPPLFHYDVKAALNQNIPTDTYLHAGGVLAQDVEIEDKIKEMMEGK